MGKVDKQKALLQKIAIRTKELRKEKGLTQRDVIYTTDINIIRIEKAEIIITVGTLQRLCDYFDITVIEFFAGMK
jgi:transcriptional regulator with XRE-family HTH domain